MKDEGMTFWTTSPHFLLVATYNDAVVGIVAIQQREKTGLTTSVTLDTIFPKIILKDIIKSNSKHVQNHELFLIRQFSKKI